MDDSHKASAEKVRSLIERERLARVLEALEPIARTRELRVCCIDLPLPPCSWLTLDPPLAGDLAIYRSTDRTFGRQTASD